MVLASDRFFNTLPRSRLSVIFWRLIWLWHCSNFDVVSRHQYSWDLLRKASTEASSFVAVTGYTLGCAKGPDDAQTCDLRTQQISFNTMTSQIPLLLFDVRISQPSHTRYPSGSPSPWGSSDRLDVMTWGFQQAQ